MLKIDNSIKHGTIGYLYLKAINKKTNSNYNFPTFHVYFYKKDKKFFTMILDYSILTDANTENESLKNALSVLSQHIIDCISKAQQSRDNINVVSFAPTSYWETFMSIRERIDNEIILRNFRKMKAEIDGTVRTKNLLDIINTTVMNDFAFTEAKLLPADCPA